MVTAKTIKGLSERLGRAEELVVTGAVFPVAGLDGYAVVRNGDGTQMYLVRFETGQEHCTCRDFTERQKALELPCKHILAAQLATDGGAGRVAPSVVAAGVDLLLGK